VPSKKIRPPVDLSGLDAHSSVKLPGTSLSPFEQNIPEEAGLTVGEYLLEDLLPDAYQSRGGVLPRNLLSKLLAGNLTHPEALEEWRNSLVEGTPQHDRYLGLQNLKQSILDNGLLHPIHIYKDGERNSYVIEAGERRYWAFWLLHEETGKYSRIPAFVHAEPSRFLQITENEEVAPLSIIGRARQAALGYLEILGIRPPTELPTLDSAYWNFYRQALWDPKDLIGQKYLPDNFWPQLEQRLNLHRVSILGLINLLGLTDDGLAISDEWYLNQSQIQAVLDAPQEIQSRLLVLAEDYGLPAPKLKQLVRLANLSDHAAFDAALREIEKTDEDRAKEKLKRHQRAPMEVHVTKIFKTFQGIDKITGGDYRSLANYIAGTRAESALQLADQLEKAAAAIRNEINQRKKSHR